MANKEPIYEYDDDEDYVPTKKVKYSQLDDNVLINKKKHTLDSDEEDEDCTKKYEILPDEDIDGQENATVDFEGETKITPFNMEEELEEGHFDQDGFYHFTKDNDQLKDAWLDNIDWEKVRKKDEVDKSDSDSDSDLLTANDENKLIAVYEQIITYLKEGETIAKALQRLGKRNKRISSVDRLKMKKLGKVSENTGSDMTSFIKLTELCNEVLGTGNMDVYQETYEMISLKIQRSKKKNKDNESILDMFGESEPSCSILKDNETASDTKDTFDEVKWEYKEMDEKKHGPFTTEKMLKLQEIGTFTAGVIYVRKITEKDEPWYKGSRMDFGIYL